MELYNKVPLSGTAPLVPLHQSQTISHRTHEDIFLFNHSTLNPVKRIYDFIKDAFI